MSTAAMAEPRIVRCLFDHSLEPHLVALELDWQGTPWAAGQRTWTLPGGWQYVGGPPRRFAIDVVRLAANSYRVRLVWNQVQVQWSQLERHQILHTSLSEVLAALGTDLAYLLDQPIPEQVPAALRAAG